MPHEITSGTPGLVTPHESIDGIVASLRGDSPGSEERLSVKISSRVHLECLRNVENISKIILQNYRKKNGTISNEFYEISLKYQKGSILTHPGCWRHYFSGASGDSLPELLAHIEGISLHEAEKILAYKLMINEHEAPRHQKFAGWQWENLPIFKIPSPQKLRSPGTDFRIYKNEIGASVFIVEKLFFKGKYFFEYYSRWCRNKTPNSHWVKALPSGKLPIFTINPNECGKFDSVLILPTEFDARFLSISKDRLLAAIPGGAENINRTDLNFLVGRTVSIELLMHELSFSLDIERALDRSKAREVSVKIVGRPGPNFPLSDLRQIATEYGFSLPEHDISAPKLSSAGLVSAGVPLPHAGSKRQHILEPVLREAGLLWFYGTEKVGKTWLALTLAHAIATGGSFGPWRAPKPRRVLFIDGDMYFDDLRSAVRCISKGQGNIETLPFSLLSARNTDYGRINLLNVEWREKIINMTHKLDVIIFDNFASLTNNKLSDFFVIHDFIRNIQSKNVSAIIVDQVNNKGGLQGILDKRRISDALVQLRIPDRHHSYEGARLVQVIKSARGDGGAAEAFIGKMIFGADTFSFEVEMSEPQEAETLLGDIRKLASIVTARDIDKLPFRAFFPKLGIKKSTASDLYRKAKGLSGSDKEALDREIQRILDERKTTDFMSEAW